MSASAGQRPPGDSPTRSGRARRRHRDARPGVLRLRGLHRRHHVQVLRGRRLVEHAQVWRHVGLLRGSRRLHRPAEPRPRRCHAERALPRGRRGQGIPRAQLRDAHDVAERVLVRRRPVDGRKAELEIRAWPHEGALFDEATGTAKNKEEARKAARKPLPLSSFEAERNERNAQLSEKDVTPCRRRSSSRRGSTRAPCT